MIIQKQHLPQYEETVKDLLPKFHCSKITEVFHQNVLCEQNAYLARQKHASTLETHFNVILCVCVYVCVRSEDEEDEDSLTGTKVRVKYGRGKTQKIYEAHIKKTDVDNGEQFYLVHYYGWNVRSADTSPMSDIDLNPFLE